MAIRLADAADIPEIMAVLEAARGIMRADGNLSQWGNGYPSVGVVGADIDASFGHLLVEEFYDELEMVCTESIELSPNGSVVTLNIPIGQWHTVHALESGTVILECKDGVYEPLGPEDTLDVGLVGRLKTFLENEARSCSMDPACVTPEYVCRMLGGTMAPEDIAESLEKAKALLR